jgi:coenzyme F420-reducing hydrogenase delta subunit
VARRRFSILKRLLEYVGIEPGRVQFTWISAAEAERFAKMMRKITADIKALGPAERLMKDYSAIAQSAH